jgi:glycosyltransferase involved in cell wall biosynthesis
MIDQRPIPFHRRPQARRLLRVGFVMEQALGHITYTKNLQAAYAREPAVEPRWFPVQQGRGALFGRVPLLRRNWTLLGSARAYAATRRNTDDLDALLFHTQTVALLSPLAARRLPVILSLDATPANMDSFGAHYGLHEAPGRIERLKRALHRGVYARAAALTTWSRWTKDSLCDDYGVDPARVTVIHPGIDLTRFPEQLERPQRARPRLLFVGGDFVRKGGPELLEAMRGGLAQICDLDIVTPAPVPATPGVRVHSDLGPNDPRLLALYSQADVFVLPTHADCLAVAIGEALASGLPVVTTGVGGQPEAVRDGISGMIVPPGEVEPLARALRRLVEDYDLRHVFGWSARCTAVERFDAAANARRLLDVVEDGIDYWQQHRRARAKTAHSEASLLGAAETLYQESVLQEQSTRAATPANTANALLESRAGRDLLAHAATMQTARSQSPSVTAAPVPFK